jgi:hypothetical protein
MTIELTGTISSGPAGSELGISHVSPVMRTGPVPAAVKEFICWLR